MARLYLTSRTDDLDAGCYVFDMQSEPVGVCTRAPHVAELLSQLVSRPEPELTVVAMALDQIFSGSWTPAQVAAFAVALRIKGESAPVLAEAARALRRSMLPVRHDLAMVFDTCGTGGDGCGTLNVSTAAALVLAACGVPVAKHGNRAASSRSGSADVMEQLGVALDLAPEHQAVLLRETNMAFLFAPLHHAALRHAAQARRELGMRTVFNLLGPLANPASATHQLLGVGDDTWRPVLAKALQELGVRRAWVVHGEDGLDEVSPSAPTRVTEIDEGRSSTFSIEPEDFGLPRAAADAMIGGDPRHNAAAMHLILSGLPHPGRSGVILNAAAGLVIAKRVSPRDAARMAEDALESGATVAAFQRWKSRLDSLRSG